MKDALLKFSAILTIFICGCLLGSAALYFHLRINSLEQQHNAFKQNVEQFAKQVNDEFVKLKKSTTQKK